MAAETAEEAPASTTEVAGTTPMGVEKPAKDTRAPEEEEEEEESHKEGGKKKPELEEEKEKEKDDAAAAAMMEQSTSSKEEEEEEERSSISSSRKDAEDPPSLEKKALEELKQLVAAAIANHEFTKVPIPEPTKEEKEKEHEEDEGGKDKPPMSVQQKEQEEGDQAKVQAAEQAVAPAAVPRKLKDCLEAEKAVPDEYDDDCDLVGVGDYITKTVSVDEDDDGAKTVEAIEETVVSVATAAASSSGQPPPLPNTDKETTPKEEEDEEVPAVEDHLLLLWGVPLVGGGERSDTILAKFLRAREWNVKEALAMIKSTVSWREEFGIEELMEEDLGLQELDKAFFVHGVDREGHPVCYNVFGVFQDKHLYHLAFGDEHKATNFLRWRLQQLERDIRARLDLRPDGVNTMLHVIDLHNSPHLYKKELRHAYKHALHLLQDNYPELVSKQVHINVPWWYLAFNTMMGAFMTQRTRSKFVFAGPTRSAEALFKYISPEQVPVQYGGMGKDEKDPVFCTSDAVTQAIIMPCSKHTVEIPVLEACIVVWELRVLGWDVSYGVEFTPDSKGGYTIIVQKMNHLGSGTDEPIVSNSFKVGEPGKLIFIIDNTKKKKKKRKTLLYRFKIRNNNNNFDECTT